MVQSNRCARSVDVFPDLSCREWTSLRSEENVFIDRRFLLLLAEILLENLLDELSLFVVSRSIGEKLLVIAALIFVLGVTLDPTEEISLRVIQLD
jgi:hypothetical protein